MRSRRALPALLAFVSLLSAASCARLYVQAPATGAPTAVGEPLGVVYLIGDFGRPAQPFEDLTDVLAGNVAAFEQDHPGVAPVILELGDNLYEEGLPHDLGAPGARAEVDKLRAIAARFARVQHSGEQVPLVLIPGNHDYNDNALVNELNLGDISRWYFLAELGIEGTGAWTHVPGDATGFADAAALYAHLDGDPAAHAAFMAPARVPQFGREVAVVAIDSELLLDLYAAGQDALAETYWDGLESRLADVPAGVWRIVAAHHPPVTYGKHGAPSFGNWVFGQGYPQFPSALHKVLAFAMPLGIVAGIVVHPAAVIVSAAPPVSTAFVTGRKQDVGSDPYDRYAAEMLRIAARYDVDVIVAGHDHNTQLIDLASIEGYSDDTLLVISGAGSKVDPVRRGPGTVAFLSDYSFVRMTRYGNGLSFEIVDRRGHIPFRYDLSR